MIRRQPIPTRTDTLLPYTTPFRAKRDLLPLRNTNVVRRLEPLSFIPQVAHPPPPGLTRNLDAHGRRRVGLRHERRRTEGINQERTQDDHRENDPGTDNQRTSSKQTADVRWAVQCQSKYDGDQHKDHRRTDEHNTSDFQNSTGTLTTGEDRKSTR